MNSIYLFLLLSFVTPNEAIKFNYIHKQGFDTSCGFSAVSSILNVYYDIDVTEKMIISNYLTNILTNNLTNIYTSSLLDLSSILTSYGIENKSFKMTFEQLNKALVKYSPVLVHMTKPQTHFLLVLDCYADNVIIADPARGLKLIQKNDFIDKWSGVVLLTASKERILNKVRLNKAVTRLKQKQRFMERLACLN